METTWEFYFISIITLLIIISLSKLLFQHKQKQNKNTPPSPPSLPVIGHLHLMNKDPLYRTLQKFSQKHGPIFSLRFGFRSVVVISSQSLIEECFTKNDLHFMNRPRFLSGKHLNYNFTTLGSTPYGPLWKNLRRLTALEIFSTTRLNELLGIRQDEIKLLIKELCKNSFQEFVKVEMKFKLSELSFNIIMRIVARKRYFGDHVENFEEASRFRKLIKEMTYLSGASNPGDFLPFLQWIDYQGLEKRMLVMKRDMDIFLQGLIDEVRNKKFYTSEGHGRKTTIESILALQQSEPESYTDEIIKGIVLVMLVAGTDTTSVTMEWAIALLLNHPEVLKNAIIEIDHIVGHERLVDELDLCKLPYLQGIINETLRLYPAVPLLVPRESSNDCTIGGFDVSSKTILLVNAWAIHRNPQLWDDPECFKPERYKDLQDDEFKFKLVPFGLGRRRCPGAGLANREVGLALAMLIQCFEWERIEGELVDMDEGPGLSLPKAKPLEAKCRVRQEMMKVLLDLS